jgi:hypothetical protein
MGELVAYEEFRERDEVFSSSFDPAERLGEDTIFYLPSGSLISRPMDRFCCIS